MSAVPDLAAYVEAFNRGDDEVYGAFYAPDVVLRNGGGTMLEGREAILDFYASVRLRLRRVMELRAVLVGNECLAAALASTFTALEDDVPLAGEVLATGDRLMHGPLPDGGWPLHQHRSHHAAPRRQAQGSCRMSPTYQPQNSTTPARRRTLIFVLFLASVLNFADRSVFSALAQTIKADLRLTDLQLGLLQG
ncbi:MAG: nuclear transport factor 2 family protein, partial [Novosphingobium sp.]